MSKKRIRRIKHFARVTDKTVGKYKVWGPACGARRKTLTLSPELVTCVPCKVIAAFQGWYTGDGE